MPEEQEHRDGHGVATERYDVIHGGKKIVFENETKKLVRIEFVS